MIFRRHFQNSVFARFSVSFYEALSTLSATLDFQINGVWGLKLTEDETQSSGLGWFSEFCVSFHVVVGEVVVSRVDPKGSRVQEKLVSESPIK